MRRRRADYFLFKKSSLAWADIFSLSEALYLARRGRYFFSNHTFPYLRAIMMIFLRAVISSALIFRTLV